MAERQIHLSASLCFCDKGGAIRPADSGSSVVAGRLSAPLSGLELRVRRSDCSRCVNERGGRQRVKVNGDR